MTETPDSGELPTIPPPTSRGGRITTLTEELQDRIVRVVRAGNYLKVAAQFCGVGESTLKSWLTRGRKAQDRLDAGADLDPEELRYVAFLAAVTQARTVAEVAAVTAWRSAFTTDWRAARDYLRATSPERFAVQSRVTISSEEAEQRMDRAVLEALTAIGVDTDPASVGAGDLDPDSALFGDVPASAFDPDDDPTDTLEDQ